VKKILLVVGTRPNYIKITQFKKIAQEHFYSKFDIKIVHTGQHFDKAMAELFFQQLDIYPDFFLNIPQASPNTQIAEIMLRLEKVLFDFMPDWVIVPGDVNSTLAAALTVQRCGFNLAHLESGLRSFDRTMPEEINRIITDEISDLFFVTEQSGIDNLIKEGKNKSKIHFVGNTMIDTLVGFTKEIDDQKVLNKYSLQKGEYVLMTMHRPATVDSQDGLRKLSAVIEEITKNRKVVFPIHPRTANNIKTFNLQTAFSNPSLLLIEPLDYFAFQKLIAHCKFVVTDSGGIQEETTFRQIPCLTLRANTERPSTILLGTNKLVSFDMEILAKEIGLIESGIWRTGEIPPMWDGKATERILKIINEIT
jgi:UDP-N-acetylglucosamine 2-epimerase (non-hydrolysing)